MTIHAPHTSTDPLGELPDRANDNDIAVASFHHGAVEPTTPLVGELYSDTVNGVMRQRASDGSWVDLWPLAHGALERTVRREQWTLPGVNIPGLGPGNVAPPYARAVAVSLTTLNYETGGIQDSRVLVFGQRSDLGAHNNYAVSCAIAHNSANWGSGASGHALIEPGFLSVPRLGGVFGVSFGGLPAVETFEAIV